MPRCPVGELSLVALLAGCNASPAPKSSICESSAPPGAVSAERRLDALRAPRLTAIEIERIEYDYADACLRRWGYRLAAADVAVQDSADAAVTRCAAELGDWRRASVRATARGDGWISSRSAFYVVQARAGACEVEGDR